MEGAQATAIGLPEQISYRLAPIVSRKRNSPDHIRVKINLTIHLEIREWAEALKRRHSISQLFEDLVEVKWNCQHAAAQNPLQPAPATRALFSSTLAELLCARPGSASPVTMDLLSAILGNSSEVDASKLEPVPADSSWSTVNATFDPQTICNRAFFRFSVP